jgi:hypothetical protein
MRQQRSSVGRELFRRGIVTAVQCILGFPAIKAEGSPHSLRIRMGYIRHLMETNKKRTFSRRVSVGTGYFSFNIARRSVAEEK